MKRQFMFMQITMQGLLPLTTEERHGIDECAIEYGLYCDYANRFETVEDAESVLEIYMGYLKSDSVVEFVLIPSYTKD